MNGMTQYTGTFLNDLQADVERVRQEVAARMAMPDGWQVLVNARVHLSDSMFIPGSSAVVEDFEDRVEAYFLLAEIQDCLVSGLTGDCLNCRELEGQHYEVAGLRVCRGADWSNPTAVSSLQVRRFERKG